MAAKEAGIACIVAAGNSAGAVQFPGLLPYVLTVAAVGRQGTYPEDSWHSQVPVIGNGLGVSEDGYFSAIFTCWGSEVKVAGPGVAVMSCYPPDTYASMDGTSMATPYVTGLAALVLAHHPDFRARGPYSARNAARVDRLFQILTQSARPLALGDPSIVTPRTGFGLANANALNVPATIPAQPLVAARTSPLAAAGAGPAWTRWPEWAPSSYTQPLMAAATPAEVTFNGSRVAAGSLTQAEIERVVREAIARLR